MSFIDDGTGKGYKAKVNNNNRLFVEAITIPRPSYYSELDESCYLIATESFIDISTTSVDNAIMYLKYNGEGHFHVVNIRTCGNGAQRWKLLKQPSTGTIIDASATITPQNINLESNKTLTSVSYKGADGNTFTNGTIIDNWINAGGHSIEEFDEALILGKGDSIGLTCEVTAAISICARIYGIEDSGDVLI